VSARVLAPGIFEDEWFGLLSDREQLLWIGLFGSLADDQGRLLDNVPLMRSRLWPYRDVALKELTTAVDRFVADGRLHRYEADGRELLQIVHWWEHQHPNWAAPSQYPSPGGWTDRVKTRINGSYVARDWDAAGGFARTLRTNPSPEDLGRDDEDAVRPNASHEPFALAREPEPEPEPDQEPEPVKSLNTLSAKTPPKLACRTPEEWQERAEALLAEARFPGDLVELGELLAGENKSGKTALSRVVRELYQPLVDLQCEVSDEQLRYGLQAAIRAAAPSVGYVRKAALNYQPGNGPPGGGNGAARSNRALDTALGSLKGAMAQRDNGEWPE